MINKSHLTAMSRKKPSSPMVVLNKKGLLKDKMLDFGCGKGFDADYFKMDKYDPYHFSSFNILLNKISQDYDVITCNYVLNVVNKTQEKTIIDQIKNLLKTGGTAYLAVRRDIIKEGFTKKSTYQRNVILDLPILKETKGFCIYILCPNKSVNFIKK